MAETTKTTVKTVLPKDIFEVEVKNHALLKLAYDSYLANSRKASATTKQRGEVRGGGKKPWKQKGTGNARVGSSRSPLWVGGGVTFGPTSDRNYHKRINSKEKKRVILGLFSELINEGKLIIVESLSFDEIKTTKAAEILENIKAEGKISVILGSNDTNAAYSFRNLAGVKIMNPKMLDPIYLLSSNYVIASKEAMKAIASTYNKSEQTIK